MTRDFVRAAVAERDGPGCWYCGSRGRRHGGMTLDHVVPQRGKRRKPTLSQLPNLRLACGRCNLRKGDGDAAEFVRALAAEGRATRRALAWLREV